MKPFSLTTTQTTIKVSAPVETHLSLKKAPISQKSVKLQVDDQGDFAVYINDQTCQPMHA